MNAGTCLRVAFASAGWRAKEQRTKSLQDALIIQGSTEIDEEAALGYACEYVKDSADAEPPWLIMEGIDGATISGLTLWSNARIVEVYHSSAKEGDIYVGSVRGQKSECKENVYKIVVDLKSGQAQLKLKLCSLMSKTECLIYCVSACAQSSPSQQSSAFPVLQSQQDWLAPSGPDPAAFMKEISSNQEVPVMMKIFLQQIMQQSVPQHSQQPQQPQTEEKKPVIEEREKEKEKESETEQRNTENIEEAKEKSEEDREGQLVNTIMMKRMEERIQAQMEAMERRLDARLSVIEGKISKYEKMFAGFGLG